MKKLEIDFQIKQDLTHIPRGVKGSPQNILRMQYAIVRRHDISKTTKTKEDTLREAIIIVKKQFPDFQPKYDATYFKNV